MIDFGESGYAVRYRIDQQPFTILALRYQKEVGFWCVEIGTAEVIDSTDKHLNFSSPTLNITQIFGK